MSIQRKIISVASDLLDYCQKTNMHLTIMQSQLKVLVSEEMYFLMQKMVSQNTLIRLEAKHLDIDDIYQAQKIKDKKN